MSKNTSPVSAKKTYFKSWLGWPFLWSIVMQIAFIASLYFIRKVTPYSIDNYRYLFSSLLQIVGSMFAFIASSTLVVYQFISSFSPNSVSYFPKKIFVSFLSITIIIISLDAFSILLLKTEISECFRNALDVLVSFNAYPIVFSISYVLFVIKSISPHNQVASLIRKAEVADTNSFRAEVTYSLEEMFLAAIRNGQGGQVRECQDALCKLIDIFSNTKRELNENSARHPEHPLRIMPDIIERISYALVDNSMGNLLHFNGHILRELSGSRYDGKRIVGVEIASAIEHIVLFCLEKHRITDAKNFIANAVFCIDEENCASTMFWGCELLIDRLRARLSDNPLETLSLIEEIFVSIHYVLEHESIDTKTCKRIISYIEKQAWVVEHCKAYGFNKIPELLNAIVQINKHTTT